MPRDRLKTEVSNLMRAFQVAVDAYDEAACRRMGINRTDGRCLDLIHLAGVTTPARLVERAGITSGAVTGVIDRLESAGYVSRQRDTTDRRRVLVTLTDRARRAIERAYGPLAADADDMLETWDDGQLMLIAEVLRNSADLYDRHLDRIQART